MQQLLRGGLRYGTEGDGVLESTAWLSRLPSRRRTSGRGASLLRALLLADSSLLLAPLLTDNFNGQRHVSSLDLQSPSLGRHAMVTACDARRVLQHSAQVLLGARRQRLRWIARQTAMMGSRP